MLVPILGSFFPVYVGSLYYFADLHKIEHFFDGVVAQTVSAPETGRLRDLPTRGDIRYDNVVMRRPGRDDPILDHVTLSISDGDRVLVTGHIGSGKSTLVKLLVGLHPYAGSLRLGGTYEVRDMSTSYIPQSPRLFNRTLRENITYGFEDARCAGEVDVLLERLDIPLFPPLNMVVGKGGSNLSGSQRTIVYLIRAFLRKAPIINLWDTTMFLLTDRATRNDNKS